MSGALGQRQYHVTPAGLAEAEMRIRAVAGDRSVLP